MLCTHGYPSSFILSEQPAGRWTDGFLGNFQEEDMHYCQETGEYIHPIFFEAQGGAEEASADEPGGTVSEACLVTSWIEAVGAVFSGFL